MLGVTQQREEIDKLNTSVTYLAQKMGDIAQILDGQSKILNNLNPNATPQNPQMDKFTMIGDLIEKSGPLLDKLFPKNNSPALIDNETIQKEMKDTFFDPIVKPRIKAYIRVVYIKNFQRVSEVLCNLIRYESTFVGRLYIICSALLC